MRDIPLRFPKITLILGAILLIVAGVYGLGIFPKLSSDDNSFNAQNTESSRVNDIVKRDFKSDTNSAIVLFTRNQGALTVDDSAYKSEVTRLLKQLNPTSQLTYYSTGASNFVATNRHDTYAVVALPGTSNDQAKTLISFMDSAKSDFLTVRVGGTAVGQYQAVQQTRHDLAIAEAISLPIVALLLLIFFRSVVATAVPLVVAFLTICGALAVAHGIQQLTSIDTYTINVITILGLGLSVDYSLLAVNRFREELALGLHRKKAAAITARTAGRTIVFSATTVVICLLSLLLFPVGFMHSISIGGAAAVIVAMVVSSVFVPALFSLLGHHIDHWKLPLPEGKQPGGMWRQIAGFGVRRPWVTLGVGIVVVALFALPILHVQSASFTYKVLPNNSSAFAVGKALDEDFDAKSASITLLATYEHPPTAAEMCRTAANLTATSGATTAATPFSSMTAPYYAPAAHLDCATIGQLAQHGRLPSALVVASTALIHGTTTRIEITPNGSATDASTVQLIRDLRARNDPGVTYQVGGIAALDHDTMSQYAARAPYALLIIGVTMLIVLTLSLGSIVIPFQAIIINSLGLIIAIGSLVMLYQFGWLQMLFHQTILGGLNPSMPILVCVIAFGLSMDYAVFLYSRIHEIYDKTNDDRQAILEGVQKTGPIITAAALIFFAVVAAFSMSRISMMQQIGFGLAIAVLVDAFVIRTLFVPAVMRLFGRASWYAPQWIKRLVIKHE